MPPMLDFASEVIVPAKELEIRSTPIVIPKPVLEKFCAITDSNYKSASIKLYENATAMDIVITEVNEMTKGQAENPEWHEQRKGAVTATKFSAVIRAVEKKSVIP